MDLLKRENPTGNSALQRLGDFLRKLVTLKSLYWNSFSSSYSQFNSPNKKDQYLNLKWRWLNMFGAHSQIPFCGCKKLLDVDWLSAWSNIGSNIRHFNDYQNRCFFNPIANKVNKLNLKISSPSWVIAYQHRRLLCHRQAQKKAFADWSNSSERAELCFKGKAPDIAEIAINNPLSWSLKNTTISWSISVLTRMPSFSVTLLKMPE